MVRRKYQPRRSDINQWLQKSIIEHYSSGFIDISIVDTYNSKQLNNKYRYKDYPTNVISLEYHDTREDFNIFFGELILCDEIIVNEAKSHNKPILNHYAHIVVHGLLHLQGYDHTTESEACEMEALEIKILNCLGMGNPYLID